MPTAIAAGDFKARCLKLPPARRDSCEPHYNRQSSWSVISANGSCKDGAD